MALTLSSFLSPHHLGNKLPSEHGRRGRWVEHALRPTREARGGWAAGPCDQRGAAGGPTQQALCETRRDCGAGGASMPRRGRLHDGRLYLHRWRLDCPVALRTARWDLQANLGGSSPSKVKPRSDSRFHDGGRAKNWFRAGPERPTLTGGERGLTPSATGQGPSHVNKGSSKELSWIGGAGAFAWSPPALPCGRSLGMEPAFPK